MATLISGGTGLVGRALLARLQSPVVLTRDPTRAKREISGEVDARSWQGLGADTFAGIESVVHLAGESVAEGRWTDSKKQRIRESRVERTRTLVQAMGACQAPPRLLVSASGVGIYGNSGDKLVAESTPAASGFLARVCVDWEREALAAAAFGTRVVILRIGIVLAPGGGALAKMALPFKLGFGAQLGSGQQWVPWIHVDDVVGLIEHALNTPQLKGPINVVAPAPVTNAAFTSALAAALHRPAFLRVPSFALRWGVGEMAAALLESQRVQPLVAEESGYRFKYRSLESALSAIFH